MPWVNIHRSIPTDNRIFRDIICGLVFNCPSSTERKEKIGVYENGNTKYSTEVIAEKVTFLTSKASEISEEEEE